MELDEELEESATITGPAKHGIASKRTPLSPSNIKRCFNTIESKNTGRYALMFS
jgi:hypothetical protein